MEVSCDAGDAKQVPRKKRIMGGEPFNRVSLRTLLSNVLYAGMVSYKGEVYDGEHPPIIEQDVFKRVHTLLWRRERSARRRPRGKCGALLGSLVFCASCGRVMGHVYTERKNRRYRYYLCHGAQKGGPTRCQAKTISAPRIEAFVVDEIRKLGKDRMLLAEELKRGQSGLTSVDAKELHEALGSLNEIWDALAPQGRENAVHLIVERVVYDAEAERLAITLKPDGIMTVADELAGRGGETTMVPEDGFVIEREVRFGRARRKHTGRPVPQGRVPRVSKMMALAIKFDGLLEEGAVSDYAEIARLGHVTRARVTQIMNLLHLAPDIQEEVLFLPRIEKGRDPIAERQLRRIAGVIEWQKQRKMWKRLKDGAARK